MRIKVLIASLFTLALSIVSTTFVILTATSKQWTIQKIYPNPLDWNWDQPACMQNRSPFYRCDLPNMWIDDNTNLPQCNFSTCFFYAPSGKNQTSCRLANDTGIERYFLSSDIQECQPVHFSGNLQIAASSFIGFGLILHLTLTMANIIASVVTRWRSHKNERDALESRHHHNRHEHHDRHDSEGSQYRLSPFTPYVVAFLVLCLVIGAILQVFAQFFAVLGLSVYAHPQPTDVINSSDFGSKFGVSGWALDIALTTYATVAWTTALASSVGIAMIYRLPRFKKLV